MGAVRHALQNGWGILCLTALWACARSATGEIDTITPFDLNQSVRHWGVDEGLPGERVYGVVQTADGYLWVNTGDRIARFNGREFRSYHVQTVPPLADTVVRKITASSDGDLWLLMRRDKIVVRRGGEFVHPRGAVPQGRGLFFSAAPGGGVFALFAGGEQEGMTLYKMTVDETTVLYGTDDREMVVLSALASGDGRIWVNTHRSGLFCFDGRTMVPVSLPEGGGSDPVRVHTLFHLRDGSLGACTFSGIYVYREGGWTFEFPFPYRPGSNPLDKICQDGGGDFWMLTGGQIMVFSPGRGFSRLSADLSSISLPIDSMTADSSGNVWMGTFRGLYQVRYTPFVTCLSPKDAPPLRVSAIAEDGAGTMWFGCYGSICHFEPGSIRLVEALRSKPFRIHALAGHSRSGVWALDRDGICLLVTGNAPVLEVPPISGWGAHHSQICAGARDNIWMATSRGLVYFDAGADEPKCALPDTPGLPVEQRIINVAAAPGGAPLFASLAGDGVFRHDPSTGEWRRFTEEGDPTAYRVAAMAVDRDGRLWATDIERTMIACWTGDSTVHRAIDEVGLGDARVFGIAHDEHGGIWLSTDTQGVARLDREKLYAKLAGSDAELEIDWFDRGDGLASRACSYSTSGIMKASDGRIWVATGAGASVADPSLWLAQRTGRRQAPVYVEGLSVDGAELLDEPLVPGSGSEPLRIGPGTQRIELRFACLNYGREENMSFRYRLVGYDEEWQEAGSRPSASYQNLSPGRYSFEAVATDPFGKRGAIQIPLSLVVLPRWWQRPWVQFAAAAAIALLAALAYRRRVGNLHRRHALQAAFSRQLIRSQEDERKRIAGELHDSLGQHLMLIKTSTKLAQQAGESGGTQGERLEEIASIASDAIGEVRNITANLRPTELDRVGLRAAMRAMVERVADHTEIEVDADFASLEGDWPEGTEIAIYRIIQEALSNAAKHSGAGKISVATARSGGRLHIAVEDDGCGFAPPGRVGGTGHGGHGLTGMRERTSLLGGSLKIISSPGGGTRLEIQIPISAAQPHP